MSKYKSLTPQEKSIIEDKGTEPPFTGKYNDFWEQGTYACKKCGSELFRSESKFDSGCGWPSFDQFMDGSVKTQPDADGKRTEIICAKCGAHLGHVFVGERLTSSNARHCVNSISLEFQPDKPIK